MSDNAVEFTTERDNSLFDNSDLSGLAKPEDMVGDQATNDMRKQITAFDAMNDANSNNRMSNRPVSTMLDLETNA